MDARDGARAVSGRAGSCGPDPGGEAPLLGNPGLPNHPRQHLKLGLGAETDDGSLVVSGDRRARHDALRIAPCACLGLTATYPDGRDEAIRELVGPVVYRRRLGEMLDAELADLAVERRFVALTPEERTRYDRAESRYRNHVEARGYRARFEEVGGNWWPAFMADTRRSPAARRAHAAFRERERLVALSEGKVALARSILAHHRAERAILFCGSTEAAEAISVRFAIPVVRAETPASERRHILQLLSDEKIRPVRGAGVSASTSGGSAGSCDGRGTAWLRCSNSWPRAPRIP